MTRTPHEPLTARPSALHAWFYLVWLSLQRQARSRQMLWIALGLMVFAVAFIAINTQAGRWDMHTWRYPRRVGPTFEHWRRDLQLERTFGPGLVAPAAPWPLGADAVQDALLVATKAVLERSSFYIFSNVLFSVFLSFLLPLWSLSFATEGVGGEREGGSLVWLFTRPLPRASIYLAKFVALLPWSLGFNLGGLGLLCLAAGEPGRLAFQLYWPAVFWATLAFSALFLFLGAVFRRPAVVAIVYAFFLETVFGNMPGYLKRASISFYARCMMFDAAQAYDVQPEKPSVYLAVDGTTALWALAGVTVAFVVLGVVWFARAEYATVE